MHWTLASDAFCCDASSSSSITSGGWEDGEDDNLVMAGLRWPCLLLWRRPRRLLGRLLLIGVGTKSKFYFGSAGAWARSCRMLNRFAVAVSIGLSI